MVISFKQVTDSPTIPERGTRLDLRLDWALRAMKVGDCLEVACKPDALKERVRRMRRKGFGGAFTIRSWTATQTRIWRRT